MTSLNPNATRTTTRPFPRPQASAPLPASSPQAIPNPESSTGGTPQGSGSIPKMSPLKEGLSPLKMPRPMKL